MNYFIDTHAHIYLSDFDEDREEIIKRATARGVRKIFMPNIDASTIQDVLRVEKESKGTCFSMLGLHPCSVKATYRHELDQLEGMLGSHSFAAIGEIGTDLYWDKTFWKEQQEAFTIQVEWAKALKLPVVIHCRESLEQTIDLADSLQDGSLTGVFHCFTGTAEQGKRIADLGFYLGMGGVVTFKNSGMDKVVPALDLSSLVLETDSPYLAPVPDRGKRNEPSYLPRIAARIAELKNISLEDVQQTTTRNANLLFKQS